MTPVLGLANHELSALGATVFDLELQPTTNHKGRLTLGYHLVTRDAWALCYMPHIRCGGEHPPHFTALGRADCEALPALWHGRDAKGQQHSGASGQCRVVEWHGRHWRFQGHVNRAVALESPGPCHAMCSAVACVRHCEVCCVGAIAAPTCYCVLIGRRLLSAGRRLRDTHPSYKFGGGVRSGMPIAVPSAQPVQLLHVGYQREIVCPESLGRYNTVHLRSAAHQRPQELPRY